MEMTLKKKRDSFTEWNPRKTSNCQFFYKYLYLFKASTYSMNQQLAVESGIGPYRNLWVISPAYGLTESDRFTQNEYDTLFSDLSMIHFFCDCMTHANRNSIIQNMCEYTL